MTTRLLEPRHEGFVLELLRYCADNTCADYPACSECMECQAADLLAELERTPV